MRWSVDLLQCNVPDSRRTKLLLPLTTSIYYWPEIRRRTYWLAIRVSVENRRLGWSFPLLFPRVDQSKSICVHAIVETHQTGAKVIDAIALTERREVFSYISMQTSNTRQDHLLAQAHWTFEWGRSDFSWSPWWWSTDSSHSPMKNDLLADSTVIGKKGRNELTVSMINLVSGYLRGCVRPSEMNE